MVSVLPAIGASREDYVIYSIGLFCFQVRSSDVVDARSNYCFKTLYLKLLRIFGDLFS